MQDVGLPVHPDLHAGRQQRLVVAALGVVDHRLIALLRDEQLHVDTALAGRRDRQQERLVGHEVRAHDDDALAGGEEQAEEQLQVVLEVEARAGGNDLAVEVSGAGFDAEKVDLVGQGLVGLAVPIAEEHGVDARDDGPLDADHEVDPVEPAADVLAQVVRRIGDVLRAHERHVAVDDQELAVVAQVGTLIAAPQGLDGEHEVPVGAHLVEPTERLPVVRLPPVGPVIEQDAHDHTPRGDLFERAEEVVGRGVGLKDVELDVHVPLGPADGIRHRVEALLVVGDEGRAVVARDRHGAQVAVQADERAEPVGRVRPQRAELEGLAGVVDVPVDVGLFAAAGPRQTRISDQQEQEHPDEGDEVDGEQPRHGRGRAAVARHDDDRGDAHDQIDHEQRDDEPARLERGVDHGTSWAGCPPSVVTGPDTRGARAVSGPNRRRRGARAWRVPGPRCARTPCARCDPSGSRRAG